MPPSEMIDIVRLRGTTSVSLADFHVKGVIARGAFGRVFLVEKRNTRDVYALKVVSQTDVTQRKMAQKLLNERDIMAFTDSKLVVELHYSFASTRYLYFAMEHHAGGDLFSLLERSQVLTEPVARFYIAEVYLALEHLHSMSIVHRDIKPENILINNTDDIRLADFGLAKVLSNDMVQATPCGTSFYIAPEIIRAIQMNGVRPLLTTSHDVKFLDMWSIGVVLYIMLAGTPPFVGQIRSKREREDLLKKIDRGVLFPDHKWASISDDAKDLVEGLLTIDPAKRMTAKEALESRFIKCWEDQPQTMLATPGIFQELGTREQIIKHMEPVVEYKNDVNQYHDETERLDTAKPAPAPGSNAVSAIPSGKVNLPLPPMLGKKKQGL
eukprot:TRINITY_DN6022_c0_g1_i3.p1 TRINITY_DN6022_c0_g1~~TRINITY_DN6022_c0_g1_i3.p1  ORF type:complete len:426 (+),score=185.27 TRINITY_DN6022_c0_g1_i3:134-1279(+)